MPRRAIGNSNVGLYAPLNEMISSLGGSYYLSYICGNTYPQQSAPYNVSDYAQAAGQYLFQIEVKPDSGAKGTAGITYPFSATSTGTYVGGGSQVYNYTYAYITITAARIYPYVFQYWQIDGGGVYSYTQTLDIYPTDSVITSNQKLIAVFA